MTNTETALTPAQSAVVRDARITRNGSRALAVDHDIAVALERKGYATVTYRHTSNGYLADVTLTAQGCKAQTAIRRAGRSR